MRDATGQITIEAGVGTQPAGDLGKEIPKRNSPMDIEPSRSRVAWVDVAKGICIVMVVMMHSTLGVGAAAGAEGWLHAAVEFARPFRMPDFFLIAGLFLAARIDAPWRLYVDRKVLHFAYFYVLWLTIQFAFKAPGLAADLGWDGALALYLKSFVEPFGTLWFIYHLALFFLTTRLVKSVPWPIVWLAAAALQIAPIHTGSMLIDEFASRYVFFYSGYIFARHVFAAAEWVERHALYGLFALVGWACLNGALVFGGFGDWPVLNLMLGYAGVGGVIAASVLLARLAVTRPVERGLAWLGAHSIVVYLAFFLPMAVSRTVLLKIGIVTDIGTVSALVTLAGVAGPVVLYLLTEWTGRGRFLFARPRWARIDGPWRRDAYAVRKAAVAAE